MENEVELILPEKTVLLVKDDWVEARVFVLGGPYKTTKTFC